jgi:hypothetical protein
MLRSGDAVIVTGGLSKGRHGVVVRFWHDIRTKDGPQPNYVVRLRGEPGERIIRADFLELEGDAA